MRVCVISHVDGGKITRGLLKTISFEMCIEADLMGLQMHRSRHGSAIKLDGMFSERS